MTEDNIIVWAVGTQIMENTDANEPEMTWNQIQADKFWTMESEFWKMLPNWENILSRDQKLTDYIKLEPDKD